MDQPSKQRKWDAVGNLRDLAVDIGVDVAGRRKADLAESEFVALHQEVLVQAPPPTPPSHPIQPARPRSRTDPVCDEVLNTMLIARVSPMRPAATTPTPHPFIFLKPQTG